jgi:hypothetical protein
LLECRQCGANIAVVVTTPNEETVGPYTFQVLRTGVERGWFPPTASVSVGGRPAIAAQDALDGRYGAAVEPTETDRAPEPAGDTSSVIGCPGCQASVPDNVLECPRCGAGLAVTVFEPSGMPVALYSFQLLRRAAEAEWVPPGSLGRLGAGPIVPLAEILAGRYDGVGESREDASSEDDGPGTMRCLKCHERTPDHLFRCSHCGVNTAIILTLADGEPVGPYSFQMLRRAVLEGWVPAGSVASVGGSPDVSPEALMESQGIEVRPAPSLPEADDLPSVADEPLLAGEPKPDAPEEAGESLGPTQRPETTSGRRRRRSLGAILAVVLVLALAAGGAVLLRPRGPDDGASAGPAAAEIPAGTWQSNVALLARRVDECVAPLIGEQPSLKAHGAALAALRRELEGRPVRWTVTVGAITSPSALKLTAVKFEEAEALAGACRTVPGLDVILAAEGEAAERLARRRGHKVTIRGVVKRVAWPAVAATPGEVRLRKAPTIVVGSIEVEEG